MIIYMKIIKMLKYNMEMTKITLMMNNFLQIFKNKTLTLTKCRIKTIIIKVI